VNDIFINVFFVLMDLIFIKVGKFYHQSIQAHLKIDTHLLEAVREKTIYNKISEFPVY